MLHGSDPRSSFKETSQCSLVSSHSLPPAFYLLDNLVVKATKGAAVVEPTPTTQTPTTSSSQPSANQTNAAPVVEKASRARRTTANSRKDVFLANGHRLAANLGRSSSLAKTNRPKRLNCSICNKLTYFRCMNCEGLPVMCTTNCALTHHDLCRDIN